jgi:hypothetical protein
MARTSTAGLGICLVGVSFEGFLVAQSAGHLAPTVLG